ncbi:MAG: hypothetical protein WBB36_07490, partial [Chitinophagales bacterium]
MKNFRLPLGILACVGLVAIIFLQTRCTNNSTPKELTNEQKIARGKYLVTIASCNDCHSPKI